MGQLKAWDPVLAEWVPVVGAGLDVRDVSGAQEEEHASTLIFPEGTVFPQGDGSVRVIEPPSGIIGAKASKAAQSIPNAVNTAMLLDTEVWDTDGFHSLTTNTDRMTIPAGLAGKYLVIASASFASDNDGARFLYLAVGGGAVVYGVSSVSAQSVQGDVTRLAVPAVVDMPAGSYIGCSVYHAAGAALNVDAHLSIYKLGSGNVAGLDSARAKLNAGTTTALSSASWADFNNALDLVVPAQAGDVLLVSLSGLWVAAASGFGYLDGATIVGGSPVNYVGSSSADYGVQGWASGILGSTSDSSVGAAVQYVVQSGDISGGTVTLRLRGRYVTAARSLYTSANNPLHWSVVNLRGGAASRDIGYEFAYAEFTSAVSIASTTEATPTNVVSAPAVVFDGNTVVVIEMYSPELTAATTSGIFVFNLWDGSTDLGRVYLVSGHHASDGRLGALSVRRRLTPTAGSHTYHLKAWKNAAFTCSIEGGAGGAGTRMPGYIRITKA